MGNIQDLQLREMHCLDNGLFGEGIKPAGADPSDGSHKVMKFKVLKASVRAYQRNLNTHNSYREFRKVRALMRERSKIR